VLITKNGLNLWMREGMQSLPLTLSVYVYLSHSPCLSLQDAVCGKTEHMVLVSVSVSVSGTGD